MKSSKLFYMTHGNYPFVWAFYTDNKYIGYYVLGHESYDCGDPSSISSAWTTNDEYYIPTEAKLLNILYGVE